MNVFLNWIAQSSVAALLLLVFAYLCRHLIEARLTRSVQHEFDRKLATFKKNLEEETNRLNAVRNAGFVALLAQRNALATKRVESAQGLWNAVIEARKGTGIAITLELLNVPKLVQNAQDPKLQLYLQSFGPPALVNSDYLLRLNNEYAQYQPFVTPTAWALYAVYAAIITFSISKLHILQAGYDPGEFLIAKHWKDVVNSALLPEDFKKVGTSPEYDLQWALKRLEERIVDELRRSMTGELAALESVGDAHRILEAADELQNSTSKAQQKMSEQKRGFVSLS